MQTIWIVAAVAAAALVGWFLWQTQAPAASDPTTNIIVAEAEFPEVLGVEFPRQITADGEYVRGVVNFFAPTGTLMLAKFEVVEASFFIPFEFDPQVRDTNDGGFEFYMATIIPQQVTLRVTLVDDAGNESEPYEFSFAVQASQDLLTGDE